MLRVESSFCPSYAAAAAAAVATLLLKSVFSCAIRSGFVTNLPDIQLGIMVFVVGPHKSINRVSPTRQSYTFRPFPRTTHHVPFVNFKASQKFIIKNDLFLIVIHSVFRRLLFCLFFPVGRQNQTDNQQQQ